jgi:hypothetical protein
MEKECEYNNLLNSIKKLNNYPEKNIDKVAKEVVKLGIGPKVEEIKKCRNTDPKLRELETEILKSYYTLVKKAIFEKDLDQYKCQKSYSEEAKSRLIKTANEKIQNLSQNINFEGLSKEEVKSEVEKLAKEFDLSKRYLGEVLKSGSGIVKVDDIHKMFITYVSTDKAIKKWIHRENVKNFKEATLEASQILLDTLVSVGSLTSSVLSECGRDYEANKSKMVNDWEQGRIDANKYDLKMKLNSAICNNDFKNVQKYNEELKAYNSRNGRDRYEDTRFL